MPLQRDNSADNVNNYEVGLLISSQAQAPEKLFNVLLATAIKESWIIAIINLHVAIFFGLILLASGYNETASLTYLAIQLAVSIVVGILLVFLISQSTERLLKQRSWSLYGLLLSDALIAAGWGSSILIYFVTSNIDQANMLVALLLAAGISTAAMSAKLLRVLVSGRVLVFLPTILYLLFAQPPNWLLHSTSLFIGFAVCMAVGYAIHVQLLREASLVVRLAQTQQKIVREADFREHFLKAITHDLRQPLSATKLFFRRLKNTHGTLADTDEAVSIDQCLRTAGSVIDDVAQLSWVDSKLPKITPAPVELGPIIERVLNVNQEIAEQQNIHIFTDTKQDFCFGDGALLERAIGNIVKNAIEHSSATRVDITVCDGALDEELEVRICDNGKGIDTEQQKSVFDAFQSNPDHSGRTDGHMGIGLSIVSNILAAHNGRVVLQSKVNQGTCFSLVLQRAPTAPARSGLKLGSAIIVDDDSDFAHELAALLAELGMSAALITAPHKIEELREGKLPRADVYFIDYRLSDTLRGNIVLESAPSAALKILISDSDDPQLITIASDLDAVFAAKHKLAKRLPELLAQH